MRQERGKRRMERDKARTRAAPPADPEKGDGSGLRGRARMRRAMDEAIKDEASRARMRRACSVEREGKKRREFRMAAGEDGPFRRTRSAEVQMEREREREREKEEQTDAMVKISTMRL